MDGGWRVLMEKEWRVEGFDGEWMCGGSVIARAQVSVTQKESTPE